MNASPRSRLLHVLGHAVRGGCETNCAVFIRHATEHAHRVIVLGEPGPMSPVLAAAGATVSHLDALRGGWLRFHSALRAAVAAEPFDGVVVWTGIRAPLVFAVLARHRRPAVLHAGNPFAAGARVRLLLHAAAVLLPRPASLGVVACSEHVARSFRHAPYYRNFHTTVCLNPVEAPAANGHRPRTIRPADAARLGMVARLDPIKDHRTLLSSFALLRQSWPHAELHLAGDGPLRRDLEQLAAAAGLAGAVHFHGSIDGVPEFLRNLDVFCYITTPAEGMGNALAEGLAQGLPCVINDLPVMREVAGPDAGHVARIAGTDAAAIARALDELLRDTEERRRYSEAAWRRAVEAFAPAAAVRTYLRALQLA